MGRRNLVSESINALTGIKTMFALMRQCGLRVGSESINALTGIKTDMQNQIVLL